MLNKTEGHYAHAECCGMQLTSNYVREKVLENTEGHNEFNQRMINSGNAHGDDTTIKHPADELTEIEKKFLSACLKNHLPAGSWSIVWQLTNGGYEEPPIREELKGPNESTK